MAHALPPRSSKADDALLQQAFDYLAAVKQVFGAQPHVHQEFTTLLKDFKEERCSSKYARMFGGLRVGCLVMKGPPPGAVSVIGRWGWEC